MDFFLVFDIDTLARLAADAPTIEVVDAVINSHVVHRHYVVNGGYATGCGYGAHLDGNIHQCFVIIEFAV